MIQQLQYINQGRGGYIVYSDQQSSVKFYYEMGSGNCVAIIFVPTIDEWIKKTNRSVEDRPPILTLAGEKATKNPARDGYYQISVNSIEIFTKTSH